MSFSFLDWSKCLCSHKENENKNLLIVAPGKSHFFNGVASEVLAWKEKSTNRKDYTRDKGYLRLVKISIWCSESSVNLKFISQLTTKRIIMQFHCFHRREIHVCMYLFIYISTASYVTVLCQWGWLCSFLSVWIGENVWSTGNLMVWNFLKC